MNERTPSPVALVTGATRGIGREVARLLASRGYRVLIGARNLESGEELARELSRERHPATAVQLDVDDDQSVLAARDRIRRDFGRLDVLVNNAGVLREADFGGRASGSSEFFMAPGLVTSRILEQTFATNFFGAVRVTNAFLDLLRSARAGRIVNVSSRLASMTLARADPARHLNLLAYNTSKAALNCATVEYAQALGNTRVKVNSVDPGHCATDINGHSGDRSVAEAAEIIVRFATLADDGPNGEFHGEQGRIPW